MGKKVEYKLGYINCPEHGKQEKKIEVTPHLEVFEKYTAKCSKCGKRLPVSF